MRRSFCLFAGIIAVCAQAAIGQDDAEQRIRKALEGRPVLVKMDLPAIRTGVEFVFVDADVSFDKAAYNRLVKDHGVALKKGDRATITAVRISPRGIELDLNGGGSPGEDWIVAGLRIVEPTPVAKSDREIEIERALQVEPNALIAGSLRSDLEYERQRRAIQDERNKRAFDEVSRVRSRYLEENRANLGSKLVVVVRSRKESVTLRDMSKSLAKYVELLPREPAVQ